MLGQSTKISEFINQKQVDEGKGVKFVDFLEKCEKGSIFV